ncbi:MAG: protein phosphatase 2C domain-containing protein [Haliea sp.]|uniref:PP2C family protein-serine/threonine phosphatase n=1 Tax=Haliea sp. TaxID=1932666 RepID=UPI0032EC1F12
MTQRSDARWQVCGDTDVGRREHNEDAFFCDDALGLMVVADGVGGHQAGEVASQVTCEVLARDVHRLGDLESAIRRANLEVRDAVAAGRGKAGMATTVVAVQFDGARYELAWVGDSRAYLWDGQLKLLTRDHSYVEALLEKGQITFAEARHHPRKNVIVQAIGLQDEDKLRVGSNGGHLKAGDILVLCSDGLSDVVDCDRLAAILSLDEPLEKRCHELVQAAVQNGGRDNVTVVLVQWVGQDSATETGAAVDPNVVWRYDPASGDYHGLPELVQPGLPVADDAGPRTAAPRRARVAPRSPEVTQMMSADEMAKLRRVALELPAKRRRQRIMGLALVALLALSAAAAWYVFGPIGGA